MQSIANQDQIANQTKRGNPSSATGTTTKKRQQIVFNRVQKEKTTNAKQQQRQLKEGEED
uniref:Uncharacterized protein n=1 Tax=Tetranychus urticae TaxID=32264 RepID=T1K162_TETUR